MRDGRYRASGVTPRPGSTGRPANPTTAATTPAAASLQARPAATRTHAPPGRPESGDRSGSRFPRRRRSSRPSLSCEQPALAPSRRPPTPGTQPHRRPGIAENVLGPARDSPSGWPRCHRSTAQSNRRRAGRRRAQPADTLTREHNEPSPSRPPAPTAAAHRDGPGSHTATSQPSPDRTRRRSAHDPRTPRTFARTNRTAETRTTQPSAGAHGTRHTAACSRAETETTAYSADKRSNPASVENHGLYGLQSGGYRFRWGHLPCSLLKKGTGLSCESGLVRVSLGNVSALR